jgi:phospholipid/cholesterol/gamma-HCH transport system ATP-binding protein
VSAPIVPFVSIESLRFGYGAKPLLTDLSLQVGRGEVVALMGGSGSGKTTVLRLLGGQLRPDAGRVVFDGEEVGALDRAGLYQLRRRMGVLFQHGALFTDLSVFENVAFPLREHTRLPARMIRDLVLMQLDEVGLRVAADLMPAQISGGMARRVALLRDAHPEVEAIGVGVPGFVDVKTGIVHELTNVPGWREVLLGRELRELTGLPAVAENDANCMGVAELRYGAARGLTDFLAITLGTGVGGAQYYYEVMMGRAACAWRT